MENEPRRTLFADSIDRHIGVGPYETIKTEIPINVSLDNLPSAARDFIIRVKMSVNGSYAAVDYILSRTTLEEHYASSGVIGDDCKIVKPQAKKYINAEFEEGIFKVKASDGFKFAIEDINSTSNNGNFFYALQCNNFSTEQKQISGSALNFKVEDKLKKQPVLLNTTGLMYNKQNLPNTSIAGNTILKKLLALKNISVDFADTKNTFYKFSTEIIEKVAFRTHEAQIVNDREVSFKEALDDEQRRISGVNVDEEIAKSMFLKNIHEAPTNLVKVVDEIFSELLNII